MMDLQAIKDRLAAATPGQWHHGILPVSPPGHIGVRTVDENDHTDAIIARCGHWSEKDFRDQIVADAELIAHAPTDLAALVKAYEELQAEAEQNAGH